MSEAASSNSLSTVQSKSESSEQNKVSRKKLATDAEYGMAPKSKIPDLSLRRNIHHQDDMLKRGQWTGFPDELIDAVRFKLLSHREFYVLCAILSKPANFHLKRAFLEQLVDKDSVTKVMEKLVSMGCLYVERVPMKGGGFCNLHHTLPLEHWTIISQVADLRKTGVRKTGVRKTGGVNKKEENQIEENKIDNRSKRHDDDDRGDKVRPPRKGKQSEIKTIRARIGSCFEDPRGEWEAIEKELERLLPDPEDRESLASYVEDYISERRMGEKFTKTNKFDKHQIKVLINLWKKGSNGKPGN